MASFGINVQLPTSIDTGDAEEIKKLNNYLYKLSEELRYMFDNLTPEDNFSNEAYVAYQQGAGAAASLEVSIEQIKAEYATKKSVADLKLTVDGIEASFTSDGIVQKINLASEGVTISGSKINLIGTVTANDYFKINSDGSMTCKNATITGTLTGSTITGGTITGATISGAVIYGNDLTAGSSDWTAYDGTTVKPFEVTSQGKLYAKQIYAYGISGLNAVVSEVVEAGNVNCDYINGYSWEWIIGHISS